MRVPEGRAASARIGPPEPVLVDAQRSDLGFQRRRGEPELRGGPRGPGYASLGLGERRLDHRPLSCAELVGERLLSVVRSRGPAREPGLVEGEGLRVGEDDRALDDVLQLADVPGPRVRSKDLDALLAHALDALPGVSRIA